MKRLSKSLPFAATTGVKLKKDMSAILKSHANESKEIMAQRTFDFLSDKYEGQHWLVIVSNHLDKTQLSMSGGFNSFNVTGVGGKSSVAFSQDLDFKCRTENHDKLFQKFCGDYTYEMILM